MLMKLTRTILFMTKIYQVDDFPGSLWQSQQSQSTETQHVHTAQVRWSAVFDTFQSPMTPSSAGLGFWQPCSSGANGLSASLRSFFPSSRQRSEHSSFPSIRCTFKDAVLCNLRSWPDQSLILISILVLPSSPWPWLPLAWATSRRWSGQTWQGWERYSAFLH